MAVSPKLELRQTQQLAMTQELRQAIGLLRLTSTELTEFVAAEVAENPFLEVEAPPEAEPPQRAAPPDISLGLGSPTGPEQAAADTGLREALLAQIRLMDANSQLLNTAARLVEEIDEKGFLCVPMRELTLALQRPRDHIEAAIGLLQKCEPTGVGARVLSECFALQLIEIGEFNEVSAAVLPRLGLYAKSGAQAVADAIGASVEQVEAVMMLVRTLDPAPGRSVRPNPVQMAIPDVAVVRDNLGGWAVELLSAHQPKVTLNKAYAADAAKAGSAAEQYVARHTKRANWLIRSLEQRGQTILRVAAEIVRVQAGFFDAGPSRLRPLTLRNVAEALNIHESTVSRVTRGKYLTCERGTFELKHFFSKAIAGVDGRGDRSALAVRDRIRQLIADEMENRPLSDGAIAVALKEEGIEIARRTVAKYREGMRIPASHARRRKRRNEGSVLVRTTLAER